MGPQVFLLAPFICSLLLCYNGVEGANLNLSQEEDLELERQLKLLNKPAFKTIVTDHGDVYDCVDFYKQPAFDHPLLKNYTTDFQMLPPSLLHTITNQHASKVNKVEIGLKGVRCPVGTVPIRRVTKEDLIKERLASKLRSTKNENTGGTQYAIVRTKPGKKYSGAGSFISLHNPSVSGRQYSAARLKIAIGPNSIQAGWRVDPTLYGGTQTRFFIRTDAGNTHCFNTFCPGFVIVSRIIPIDVVFGNISKPGEPAYEVRVFIFRGKNGNWNLQVGRNNRVIGYWPSQLFTGLASYAEWGGEAYGPPGIPTPPMGTGILPRRQDTRYDAYFRQISEYDEWGKLVDANDLEEFKESQYYAVIDEGYRGEGFKHLAIYGGPGGN